MFHTLLDNGNIEILLSLSKLFPKTLGSFCHSRMQTQCQHPKSKSVNLLVVENDIGLPDAVERHSNHRNATKFRAVPDQMGINPDLSEPAVGCEDLVFLILKKTNRKWSKFNLFYCSRDLYWELLEITLQ